MPTDTTDVGVGVAGIGAVVAELCEDSGDPNEAIVDLCWRKIEQVDPDWETYQPVMEWGPVREQIEIALQVIPYALKAVQALSRRDDRRRGAGQ